jgi:CheY-like chemotaxis protein
VRTNLDPTRRFVADQGKLVQVAINLIDNACKALAGGGGDTVTVSTGVDGDVSWLCIEDNGHGVSAELRSKIFEPFFTTDERRAGTGLGLTLSREYAERHRGSLVFEPRTGGGSRFVLRVPSDTGLAVPVSRAPRQSERYTTNSNRVLVIDDEPAVLRAFRRVLSPTYAVTVVNDGLEALQKIRESEGFDAVICDINMPQLGGVDFYRQLELTHPELARRVVFCSGGVFGEEAREFIESTRNPVLHKPLAPQALLDALSGFLNRRRSA